jgi:hypothetical protein
MTSYPPKIPGSATHLASSVTTAASHLTGGTALVVRLVNYHVPPADISRIVAILNGCNQTTVEEAQLLWRLHNLNVPVQDINLIIDAMQQREGDDTAPPAYDS